MAEGLTLVNDFIEEVQRVVGPFLSDLGFVLDEVVDEGGSIGAIAYYRGQDCRIQVYYTAREGEINAMIAPLDAPNEHGLYGRSGKWRHFNDFADTPDLTVEELVRQLREERPSLDTTAKRLEWLTRRMAKDFDSARKGVVEWANEL